MVQDDVRITQAAFPDANCAIDGSGCYILVEYARGAPAIARGNKPHRAWRNAAKVVSDRKLLQKVKRSLAFARLQTPPTEKDI